MAGNYQKGMYNQLMEVMLSEVKGVLVK